MQKKNIILKNNKGIALITLVVAVLMMLIISSIIIYNTVSYLKVNNLNKMYSDIRVLNEQIFLYFSNNQNLPILDSKYSKKLNNNILEGYTAEDFYVIDIDRIDKNIKSNLNYGKDYYDKKYNGTDIYVINVSTHKIYYVKGITMDNTTYYTIPGEDNYTKVEEGLVYANPPILENGLKSVKYNGSSASEISQYDVNWYDYSGDISNWAIAKKADNSLYMWVPRYAYNKKDNQIVFLQGTTDKPIRKEDEGKIDFTTEEWLIPSAFQNKEKEQFTGTWLSLGSDYNKVTTIENLIKAVYNLTDKDNINGEQNITITGNEFAYYNPVIPVGFKTVPTKDASWNSTNGTQVDGWNDGLVIEDKDGNQFVWVPVDGTKVEYKKWCTTGKLYTGTTNDTLPMLNNTDTNEIQAYEEKQIGAYGGFYIGRYEAGTELEYNERNKKATPIVKRNQKPWNYISYDNAKASSESMYKTNEVQSLLVTGTMWDTVMKWLENDNINVQTNSSGWGNYNDVEVTEINGYYNNHKMEESQFISAKSKLVNESYILKTGESEFTKKKNIYDLAGNMWEFTNEIYLSNCVCRGGGYDNFASNYPAAYRDNYATSDVAYNVRSFRVALYIK